MVPDIRYPGVYIKETIAFGNSVVPVPTSIPVFIGYTQRTSYQGTSLLNRAVRILSFSDYIEKFGTEFPQTEYTISVSNQTIDFTDVNGQGYEIVTSSPEHRLPAGIKLFYANGGGECYVLSIGDYTSHFDRSKFFDAIDLLKDEPDPSILVLPDAIIADSQSAYNIQNHAIRHCGETKNIFAILDIPEGYKEPTGTSDCIENFRNGVGGIFPSHNSYAAAYYPWIHTSVLQFSDVDHRNISSASYPLVASLLTAEFTDTNGIITPDTAQYISCFTNNGTSNDGAHSLEDADLNFRNTSAQYKLLLKSVLKKLNLMPPSAAMAGIYTAVDNTRGVWKAPANVGLQSVIAPAVIVDAHTQEDLNTPMNGKSVCAIRAFTGRGTLVWGARTLDSNSNDWRYINVRRTIIFVEQSIKEALKMFVFAANDSGTWNSVSSMISGFLNGLWQQGALAGAKSSEAFSVHIGLGSTMTSDDLAEGTMRVAVMVALSHPAEFIEITFEQKMQTT